MFPILFQTIQRDSAISFPMLGDFSINPPSYFTIFGKNIYFYGVLIALGFLLAISYCAHNSRRFGIKQDDFYDFALWLIPFSIIGARLYFVLFQPADYLENPLKIFAVWEGGLAIYGGVIAGIIVAWLGVQAQKNSRGRPAGSCGLWPAHRADPGPLGQLHESGGFWDRDGDFLPHGPYCTGRNHDLCPPHLSL